MQKHWVWLATRSGIGVRGRAELLRRFGTAERIYAMDRAALQAEEGLRQSWLEPLLDKTLDGAERILAQCDRFDIRLLTYAEPAYPERLRNIADPPALLYYQAACRILTTRPRSPLSAHAGAAPMACCTQSSSPA